jgi:phosphate transport system permease protein
MQNHLTLTPQQILVPRSTLTARSSRDRRVGKLMTVLACVPILLILAIVVVLVVRSWPILKVVPLWDLLTGLDWHPARGKFGFLPFIIGTFWVTVVAMLLAAPPCLLTAIYLSEYARPATRTFMKPLIDLLAAIPSVVYGVWGVVVIVPWVGGFLSPFMERWLGFIPFFRSTNPTGYSLVAGGLVLAVMVAPFIIAVTYEILHTVPDGLREASLAMGATRWQTVKYAVGNVPILPGSIFDPAYPLPALIANNYGEMMSIPLYDAALLGAALLLLIIVLAFNVLSTLVLRKMIRRASSI